MRSGKSSQKVTIVDVAKRAGVSIKTVSRVLNSEPNVRSDTREKVLKAAKALHYQPNPSARGLAGNRSFSIGLLYENPQEFGYVKDALNGVIGTCEAEGYSLLMRPCGEQVNSEEVRKFVAQTRVDGAVLTAPVCDEPEVTDLLEELGVPFAQLAPKAPRSDWIAVQCNDEDASYDMTDYLISLGHRRIGFIKGHPDHGATEKRLAGYRRCLEDHDIPFDRALVIQGYFDFESGQRCARKLLDLPNPPTAIFASNDDMAAGVIFTARERGIGVPEELSVAGFDDSPAASHTWPPLTTIKQPIVEMAARATQRLIGRLRGASDEADEETFTCELIVRRSTAKRGH